MLLPKKTLEQVTDIDRWFLFEMLKKYRYTWQILLKVGMILPSPTWVVYTHTIMAAFLLLN
jgi:hypothetical protein